MNKAGVVRRIDFVPEDICKDCYYIASQSMGDAENLYYSMAHNVNNMGHALFIDTQGGFIRGFLLGHAASGVKDAKISAFFVDYRYRGCGIGGRLLKAYEQYARAAGAQKISLQTRVVPATLAFYEKHRFQRLGMSNLMEKTL